MNAILEITSGGARRLALGAALIAGALASGTSHAHEPEQTQASMRSAGAQLYASPSQVQMVQEKLREQGRKPGADGVWDESTIAEVRDFQKANGLAPTGQLDTSVLSALQIGDVLEGETSSDFLDGLLRADESSDAADSAASSGRGTPIYVSPVHVAQIQHRLREQGHYSGEVDGTWGPQTAQAANAFREAHGLEASDGLDIALLRALNRQSSQVPKLASEAVSRTQGVPLEAGPVEIRAVQRELAQEGHEVGAVDGILGDNTREALREFQQENDLESTGTLTLPTLAALGVDLTSKGEQRGFETRARRDSVTERETDPDAVATAEPKD